MIKHKYLTLLYRNDIQLGLERDETFKVIRRAILKDLTTVSKKRLFVKFGAWRKIGNEI